jgi:molybdate transport system substrate-binding protein
MLSAIMCLAAGPARAAQTQLVVFAASSLREAFDKLADQFKRRHPGVEVMLNLAGSQQLRLQIEQGAAADVFASADRRQMDALKAGGWVLEERIFARNEPALAVSSASRALVRSLADLPKATRIVIAAPQVPIGAYTAEILEGAYRKYGPDFQKEVEARIASTELNVRQVLAKVELGEADAGVVYRTDIAGARTAIAAVPIPPELNVRAEYPVAVLKGSRRPELAAAWIELLTSSAGRTVLGELGFLPPTDDAGKRP